MSPDSATVITMLALALLGVGAVIRMLPVGTCSQCGHCERERVRRELELDAMSAKVYGIPLCAVCRRHHGPNQDHRS